MPDASTASHLRRVAVAVAGATTSLVILLGPDATAVAPPQEATFRHLVLRSAVAQPQFPKEQLVVGKNCADPSVTADPSGKGYWMVCTGGGPPSVPLRHSKDLLHWKLVRHALATKTNHMAWAVTSYWAPTMAYFGNKWHLYISGRDRQGRMRIGEGISKTAEGPYHFGRTPMVHTPGFKDIDPFVFQDRGKNYLLYKTSRLADGSHTALWMARLNAAGTAIGHAWKLLSGTHGIIENPALVREHGQLDLYFSQGSFDTPGYAIGVARSHGMHGTFHRKARPIMDSSKHWFGPGGESPVTTPTGASAMVWHSYPAGPFRENREVLAGRVGFSHGWPTMPANSLH